MILMMAIYSWGSAVYTWVSEHVGKSSSCANVSRVRLGIIAFPVGVMAAPFTEASHLTGFGAPLPFKLSASVFRIGLAAQSSFTHFEPRFGGMLPSTMDREHPFPLYWITPSAQSGLTSGSYEIDGQATLLYSSPNRGAMAWRQLPTHNYILLAGTCHVN